MAQTMGATELDGAAPHGRNPREDLHTRWHGDDHGCSDEIGLRVSVHAHGVHVVGPDDEAHNANGHHGVGHAEITEDRLLGEGGDDVADDAEARQNQDVDFRMAEEPEQMLEQDRVTTGCGFKERGAEVAVGQQHGDATCENRQRQQQQEHGHQHGPDKQRHLVQRHARGAHVENCGDEVDGTENGRCTGKWSDRMAKSMAGPGWPVVESGG